MVHNQENDNKFLALVQSGALLVGKDGTVINTKTNRQIGAMGSGGYLKISMLIKDGSEKAICHMQVHRLVWLAYKGPIPEGVEVNHKDFNRRNPSLDNLELLTPQENRAHFENSNQPKYRIDSATASLMSKKRRTVGNKYKRGMPISRLA